MSISSSSDIDRASKSRRKKNGRGDARYRIREVSRLTGLSADTLRYYEKIKLLRRVARTTSGIRTYDERDLSRLRFIQRAKSMRFTLEEIARLLEMREDPLHARAEVRELSHHKLREVESQIKELQALRGELSLLLNLCQATESGCPIIDKLDNKSARSKPRRK